MTLRLATRMQSAPRSFIREILKVTESPDIISFAGGLPNPSLFDIEGLRNAAHDVITEEGRAVFQYTTTEGYGPLREKVAILPGTPFWVDGGGDRSIRLNFSNADEDRISVGTVKLAKVIRSLVQDTGA